MIFSTTALENLILVQVAAAVPQTTGCKDCPPVQERAVTEYAGMPPACARARLAAACIT